MRQQQGCSGVRGCPDGLTGMQKQHRSCTRERAAVASCWTRQPKSRSLAACHGPSLCRQMPELGHSWVHHPRAQHGLMVLDALLSRGREVACNKAVQSPHMLGAGSSLEGSCLGCLMPWVQGIRPAHAGLELGLGLGLTSGRSMPRAPSMAQRAWMTSMVRYRSKVSGSAERPAESQP